MLKFIKRFSLTLVALIVLAIIVLFAWLWWMNESIPGTAPPVTTKIFDSRYESVTAPLRELLIETQNEHRLPSLSAAVAVDGELVWAGAVGYSDVGDRVPADLETVYRIGSISKSMTSALLLNLHEQQRLNIDTSLGSYAGEVEPWSQVTLRQLATHQGGVRHYREGVDMLWENFHNTHYPTTESALVRIEQTDPLFPPGSDFLYSTYGYTLLAYGMEQAAGANFATLMQDELFAPLGLAHTSLEDQSASELPLATPYIEMGDYNYRAPEVDLSYKYAGGGVVSTPVDLVTFGSALLAGEYLGSEALNQLWQVAPLSNGQPNDNNYAMGFRVHETELGPRISHGGLSVGGQSFLAIYPEQDITVAFVMNTTPSERNLSREALAEKMVKIVLGAQLSGPNTLYVEAGELYTAAGEKFVMRGFNEMFVWSDDPTGEKYIPEIAKSGANSVRLVWDHDAQNMPGLRTLIENAIEHKMVAIPECHNATGKWGDELQKCVKFWSHPELIKTIEDHKQWSIVNIANEAGDHSITDEQFLEVYKNAITSLREWGYTVPIMIDAAGWGQNVDQLLRVAPALQEHDPWKNVIFSTHSYWGPEVAIENYHKVAKASEKQGVAMIIGEGPSVTRVGQCDDPKPLPYEEGMRILEAHDTGWLNWSWGGMKNGDCDDYRYFDITKNGQFGQWWHTAGANIVALSPYSVMQTSERPPSFFPDGVVPVSGVYLHVERLELAVGQQADFQVIVAPANAANKDYSLEITGDVASFELDKNNNTLSAIAPGEVTLRAVTEDGELAWSQSLVASL